MLPRQILTAEDEKIFFHSFRSGSFNKDAGDFHQLSSNWVQEVHNRDCKANSFLVEGKGVLEWEVKQHKMECCCFRADLCGQKSEHDEVRGIFVVSCTLYTAELQCEASKEP